MMGRSEEKPSRSLWVGNVNPDTADHELHAIFQQYGPIENVKVPLPLPPSSSSSSPIAICMPPYGSYPLRDAVYAR
jgi:RNA recognition motif-containing protein